MTTQQIFKNTRDSEDSSRFYMEDGILFHDLDEVPFDKYEDGTGFIHATGREWWDENHQIWLTEYEEVVNV